MQQHLNTAARSLGNDLGKLRVLEMLLWNNVNAGDRFGTCGSLLQAALLCLLNAVLASAMRCLVLDVAAVEVTYSQVGRPGPTSPPPQMRDHDEVIIAIRSARFAPVALEAGTGGCAEVKAQHV